VYLLLQPNRAYMASGEAASNTDVE